MAGCSLRGKKTESSWFPWHHNRPDPSYISRACTSMETHMHMRVHTRRSNCTPEECRRRPHLTRPRMQARLRRPAAFCRGALPASSYICVPSNLAKLFRSPLCLRLRFDLHIVKHGVPNIAPWCLDAPRNRDLQPTSTPPAQGRHLATTGPPNLACPHHLSQEITSHAFKRGCTSQNPNYPPSATSLGASRA